jgi:hypothetical protein
VYGRTTTGDLFNLLKDPLQPLLMIADVPGMRELSARAFRARKKKPPKTRS